MQNFDKHTDDQLVAAYANGNNEAFDALLQRHQSRVYNYIYQMKIFFRKLSSKPSPQSVRDDIPKTVNLPHGSTVSPEISSLTLSVRRKLRRPYHPMTRTSIYSTAKNSATIQSKIL